ncbi:MAG: cytidine deaminase [Bacteroidales bacterium]|nr:cytidine deaminase [Bacteroidales bacterium]
MRKVEIAAKITYCSIEELSAAQKQLVGQAKKACDLAYAPYSDFAVGAALQLDNGEIVLGANQENAAYPSGLCAERVALFAAAARYPQAVPVRLAVAAKRLAPARDMAVPAQAVCSRRESHGFTLRPVTPCGACRQVLSEAERRYGRSMELLLFGEEETAVISSGADLLPLSFNL